MKIDAKTTKNIIYNINNAIISNNTAFAQLARVGFSVEEPPKAHTKSIINPTNGIAVINNVINQSLTDITEEFCVTASIKNSYEWLKKIKINKVFN